MDVRDSYFKGPFLALLSVIFLRIYLGGLQGSLVLESLILIIMISTAYQTIFYDFSPPYASFNKR